MSRAKYLAHMTKTVLNSKTGPAAAFAHAALPAAAA